MSRQKTFFVVITILYLLFSLLLHAQDKNSNLKNLINKADSLHLANNFKEAKKFYKTALKLDKNSVEALAGLGKIAFSQQNWGKAKSKFDHIIKIDSKNIEAHYHKGICHREIGVNKVLLLRKLEWDKSEKSFKFAISEDSLYQDVLYQFARLLRYKKKYEEAIQVCHEQIRLKPELVGPQVNIFRLYRYFIKYRNKKEALEWLNAQPWDHAKYFIGEKLRREEELFEADSVLNFLTTQPLSISKQPIYLSLAIIKYKQKLAESGEEFYRRAINEINSRVDANLIFQDLKYIITDKELKNYLALNSVEDYQKFFKSVWVSKDPTPAAKINVRLTEHYRRILYAEEYYEYDGFRTWFNNPDKLSYFKYNAPFLLNNELNDKGLIYIRHGKANDWSVTLGPDVRHNESWLYYANQNRKKMIFHFVLENSPNYWRFTPNLTNPKILDDLLTWDPIYHRLLVSSQLERMALTEELAIKSSETVTTGITTEQHTWEKKFKNIPIPYTMFSFRGPNGKSNLDIYYTIYSADIKSDKKSIKIEKGISIHGKNWTPVIIERANDFLHLNKKITPIDIYSIQVPPDSYNVALYVHPENMDYLGGWKYGKKIEDYSKPTLAVSDIILANSIEPAEELNKFVKNNLQIIPNLTRRYSHKKPVYIYFEIYNLSLDTEQKSNYNIKYTIKLIKDRSEGIKKIFSFFRRGKSTITTDIAREGNDEFSVEYLALDVSKVKPGTYMLEIQILDKNSGNIVNKQQDVQLF